MGLKVDICEDALEIIKGWGLPPSLYSWLLRTIQADLSTRISSAIGDIHCIAPLRLRRYTLSAPDESGDFLHHFVFLVGDEKYRRVIWLADHRTGGDDF